MGQGRGEGPSAHLLPVLRPVEAVAVRPVVTRARHVRQQLVGAHAWGEGGDRYGEGQSAI